MEPGEGAPQQAVRVLRSEERGRGGFGWLEARYAFSFADCYDPTRMGFRSLRVLNEDRIQPDSGFPTHPHQDMEILTVVLAGELEHRDSLGHGSRVRLGEVQRMTAGRGILHSERNPSASEVLHLLQIWILPAERGLEPGYEQRAFPTPPGRFVSVATPDGAQGSLRIHQDARVHRLALPPGARSEYSLAPGRGAWVRVCPGEARVAGESLAAGDAVAVEGAATVPCEGGARAADLLLFDLA